MKKIKSFRLKCRFYYNFNVFTIDLYSKIVYVIGGIRFRTVGSMSVKVGDEDKNNWAAFKPFGSTSKIMYLITN